MEKQRCRGAFSIILFDIDHFKLVNDAYGNQVGDSVLVEVDEMAKANMRASDSIGRNRVVS